MRIIEIEIVKWRAFHNLKLEISKESPIACLVGANGSGKSQILELITAVSQQIGLTNGFVSNRPSPFSEDANFSVTFWIDENLVPGIENAALYADGYFARWDRTIRYSYSKAAGTTIKAGSSGEAGPEISQTIIQQIRADGNIYFLSLDADRSYPKISIQPHELNVAFLTDWNAQNKGSSFQATKNLYEEWYKYFAGFENQTNALFAQAVRQARESGSSDPKFVDIFEGFKKSIRSILPDLLFVGIDPSTREIRFDTAGSALSFDQMSGGEREIAFIVGQIDRFHLKKGMLLIDEPELHLNADLLRRWIEFLRGNVEAGQIWFATHSLEVVEVCGTSSSYILEKDPSSKRTSARKVDDEPLLVTLSRALGSPAFSINNLSFLFIEGTEEIGERERFKLASSAPAHVRFIESGNCSDVQKRLTHIRQFADLSGQSIRAGGIIDKDWRTQKDCSLLEEEGLHVLSVHEIENFFIDPPTVKHHLMSTGRKPDEYANMLREATDARFGIWIFDSARTQTKFREFAAPTTQTKEFIYKVKWSSAIDDETLA